MVTATPPPMLCLLLKRAVTPFPPLSASPEIIFRTGSDVNKVNEQTFYGSFVIVMPKQGNIHLQLKKGKNFGKRL